MIETKGYAALSATSPLEPWSFERRDVGEHDIELEILYCGVCHSDIHFARNEWLQTVYPVVPGHEIVGRVTMVGSKVSSFKIGDPAAVGTIVDCCGTCRECKNNLEQYCEKGFTMTFNSFDKYTQGVTYGGYSKLIMVNEKYVLKIPQEFKQEDLAAVAPLLCAGITTYSPLKFWEIGKGHTVGIIGIGGLGHIAVKLARALGAHVVAITTSPDKQTDALRLGAHEAVLSTDNAAMQKHHNSLDFIVNTIPFSHDLSTYLALLRLNGKMCLVGIPNQPHEPLYANALIEKRKSLAGSLIGSIKETQELLDFCGKNQITADIEMIPIQQINEAFNKVVDKEVRYRYVIDLASC